MIHLLAFVTVNAVLFSGSGFDLAAGHFWGWGVGLGAHVLVVLGNATTFKQRMIERELRHAGGREASAVPSPSRVAPVLMIHKIPCVTYD